MILIGLLAVAGWTAVLTRGAGPWDLLKRLRAAWTGGPLGCPMCTGTWVGLTLGALQLAAERWPSLGPVLALLLMAGAGSFASCSHSLLHELLAEARYTLRAVSDHIERDRPRDP